MDRKKEYLELKNVQTMAFLLYEYHLRKPGAKNDAESSDKAQKYLASLESITKKVKEFEKANPKDADDAKKVKDDGVSEKRQKELSLEYIGEPFTLASLLSLFSFLSPNTKSDGDEKD